MATFNWPPSYDSELSRKPRTSNAKFGDGYEQRTGDGINTNPQSWGLVFAGLTDADADAIDAFLAARNATESFGWTPPRRAAGKFICREWRMPIKSYNNNTLTATFEQVFE